MQLLKKDIEKILKKAGLDPSAAEKPPKPEMGDYAFPCFELARKQKKNPTKLALEMSGKMKPSGFVKDIKAMGPYINFYSDWQKLGSKVVMEAIEKDGDYGRGTKGQRIMVEFAHPNTHKALHIGHARNMTLGEALSRTMSFAGYDVVRVNYQGDIGPHVARCIWGLMNLDLKEPRENRGRWLGEVYALASEKAKNYKVELQLKQVNKDLYAGKPELLKVCKKTRQWSLEYFEKVYRDFGIKFDRYYFESEVEDPAIKLAKKLLKDGIAKLSDGAIVMDLEKYGLGIYVLLTQDETPLYSVKDFVLAQLQDKEYHPERIIHVVGSEQELHFRQVIKSLELMQSPIAKKEYHLSYGLVNLESGKMKSREGKVILYEDLKEKVMEKAREITRQKNPDLSESETEDISRKVGLGALKYDMVKISPEKTIIFNWDRALSFEGNNAPYLQYTHARCCSIERKAGNAKSEPESQQQPEDLKPEHTESAAQQKTGRPGSFDASLLTHEKEQPLLRHISEFPDTVERAGREMRPHYIATYAFELCDLFNEFYQHVPVLKAEKNLMDARLALVDAVRITLRNALGLLGIEAPEKM